MSTKVGLLTAAGLSTPSPSAMARVRWVLPAPSGPTRATTAPGNRSAPSCRPNASVAARSAIGMEQVATAVNGPRELLQHFELDVLEADLGRAAAMDLQADHAAPRQLRVLVIADQIAVDPNLHVRTLRFHNVLVPFAGLDELLASFLHEQAAAALFVELAPPAGADVGLWAAHLAVRQRLTPKLHAAVGRVRRQLYLQRQFEIRDGQVRFQEGV